MTLPTKKQFEKDWGKKCKTFAPLCCVCVAWHAYETLADLYQIKKRVPKLSKLHDKTK